MKRMVNFRLSAQALTTLSILEEKLHSSKTAVIEKAIDFYAKKKLSSKKSILEFAGILNEKEAERMLTTIREGRVNKNEEVDL